MMGAKETAVALMLVAAGSRPGLATWNDVVESYQRVRDYTTLYEKEERAISNGERQTIRLSFRKPLDVRMDWLNDKGKVDQAAVYRRGHNGDKIVARRSGILGGLAGTVTLDPNDRMAMQDSRHPITEIGLGHIIDRIADGLRGGKLTAGPVREVPLDARPAYQFKFETSSGADVLGVAGARRAIVWVDRELKLPIRVDVLDAKDTLVEHHRFKELRINVGLTDDTFSL